MKIVVCPLSQLPETICRFNAQNVVSLVRDEELIARERKTVRENGVPPDRHLWLEMDDIADEIEGMIAPNEKHVKDLIDFFQQWDRAQSVVIHCYAGISRSTAAAFIAACVLAPHIDEVEMAKRLRLASPTARPNTRFIAVADSYLNRNGRMIRAVSDIGDGEGAYESEAFELRFI